MGNDIARATYPRYCLEMSEFNFPSPLGSFPKDNVLTKQLVKLSRWRPPRAPARTLTFVNDEKPRAVGLDSTSRVAMEALMC